MSANKKLDQLVTRLENHLECWKQFNQFVTLARSKKFSNEDEHEFLEVKSVLVQELELILSAVEVANPNRQEVHELIGSVPSLRALSEMNEGAIRNLENSWHKIYIGWHAILGQLKVRLNSEESKGGLSSMFGKKEK
jgi:hypothetical protein